MPRYDFSCSNGHTHEERRGYEVSSVPCASCDETAQRVPVYIEQYTRTDSAGMQGRMGKAGTIPESVERYARNSATIEKETGNKSGLKLR